MARNIWLAVALAAALLLAWQGTITPRPLPASAPATAFSAERALVDIRDLASRPHAIATPANDRVRARLVERLTQLGLETRIQEADALSSSAKYPAWLAGAHVRNVVGVLPGKDRNAPALLLMAHHDTVPGSPGAADDTTGVASLLEVVRALKLRGTPARDVIVLFTDGEEFGLSGAEAWFADPALAARTGLIINLEARGGGGRANMFETGADNGALIDVFKASAKSPISSALAVFLYEKMPNDTDFSVAKRLGKTGLNFAFIGRQFDYHSPTSTPANLDPGSVQSMGEQVLAVASELAFAPKLPGKAPSAVYSQTFGDFVLAYPPMIGWLVWLLAGGLLVLAGWRTRKAGGTLGRMDGLKGAAGALLVLTTAALLLNLARRATSVGFGFMEQRPLLAQWGVWETCMILLALGSALLIPALMTRPTRRLAIALGALVVGVLGSLLGGFDPVGLGLGVASGLLALLALGRPPAREGAWAGVLILAFLLTGLVQLFVPQVAFLLAWPLVLAAAGAAATRWSGDSRLQPILAVVAALVCGWLGVYLHLTAQGLDLPALLGLFPFLAVLALWPLAQPGEGETFGLAPAALALIVAIGLLGFIRFSDPWSARYPATVFVSHVTDTTGKRAWLTTPALSPWTRQVLAPHGGTIQETSLPPYAERPIYAAPAPLLPVPAPTLVSRIEPDGRVSVILTPQPGSRNALITLKLTTAVTDVRLQGKPAVWLTKPGELNHLRWVGTGAPVVISFKPATNGQGAAEVNYATGVDGWPTGAPPLPPLPKNTMAWDVSGSSVTTGKGHRPLVAAGQDC